MSILNTLILDLIKKIFIDIAKEKSKEWWKQLTKQTFEEKLLIVAISKIKNFNEFYRSEGISEEDIESFLTQFQDITIKNLNMDVIIKCECNAENLYKYIESLSKGKIEEVEFYKYKVYIEALCKTICELIPEICGNKDFYNTFDIKLSINTLKILQDIYIKLGKSENQLEDLMIVNGRLIHPLVLLGKIEENGSRKFKLYQPKYESILEKSDKYRNDIDAENELYYVDNFFTCISWKVEIVELLDEAIALAEYFREKITDKLYEIRWTVLAQEEYDNLRKYILEELKNIILNLQKNHSKDEIIYKVKGIKNYANNKSFNKVLFIKGEKGVGKTRLLTKYIRNPNLDYDNKSFTFNIPIDIDKIINDVPIENVVIEAMKKYLDIKFNDIEHVNNFIERIKSYKFRINFVIDDLQKICVKKPDRYREIKDFIKLYSKYEWIYWIISISRNGLFHIIEDDDFLKDYSFKDNNENYSKNSKNINICWADLDECNKNSKIGLEILKQYFPNKSILLEHFKTSIILNNPLLAHMCGIIDEEKDIDKYCVFSLEFLIKFNEYVNTNIFANLNREEEKVEIKNELNAFIEYMLTKQSTYIESSESIISEMNMLMEELEIRCLIEKEKQIKKDKYDIDIKSPKIHLLFEIYWAYKIVILYSHCKEEPINTALQLYSKFDGLEEELISTFILYLDRENKSNEIKQIIDEGIKIDKKSGLLFSMNNLKDEYKKYLFTKLKNEDTMLNLTNQELFALLYFIDNNTFTAEYKCNILNKYIDQVHEMKLDKYFNSVVLDVLEQKNTIEGINKCLIEFIKCKYVRISDQLGEIFADYFYEIIEKQHLSLKEVIEIILAIIEKNKEDIINTREMVFTKGPQEASTFIEYYLRHVFKRLIYGFTKKDMVLHDLFLNEKYYFKFKPEPDIAHIIRQSLTIEYGNYYCHNYNGKFQKCYIESVNKLVKKDGDTKMKIAFHLISNSIQDETELVDERFKYALNKIKSSKQMKEFCSNPSIKKFIDENLC